jgi:hypothetical protein
VTTLPETCQLLVSRSERPVPPRMRTMSSLYKTTPASGGIRSGIDTYATITGIGSSLRGGLLMQAKELDMVIIHMGMELNLHKTLCHLLVAQLQVELNLDKTLCHFLVAQLQDLEPNVSRKH